MQDANIARKIVRALNITAEDNVLEIGPGPGALTNFLQDAGPRRLLLIEKDAYWAGTRLRAGQGRDDTWQGGRLSVVLADALTISWERFVEPWKFIGNLPYNVASPLMWEIFSRASGLSRAVFMVQKEVGQRIVAKPSTAEYGALSVWLQSFTVPKLEFIVPPQVFRPRPKVDSAVLSFAPLLNVTEGGERKFSPERLAQALHFCFQRRRKQLGVIIRAAGGAADWPERLGLDTRLRPEALTVEEFQKLAASGIFARK